MGARNSWTCIQIIPQHMLRQKEGKDKCLYNFLMKEQIVDYMMDKATLLIHFKIHLFDKEVLELAFCYTQLSLVLSTYSTQSNSYLLHGQRSD